MNQSQPAPKQTSGSGLLSSLLLVLVSLVVAFLIAEAVLRLFMKDDIVLFPRYHTDARYGEFTLRRTRPDTRYWHTSVDGSWEFITNSQGFRNTQEFTPEKPRGALRVLALGDSQTQGFEVHQHETYAAVIENYLKQEGYRAEVMNAGVSGFSTAEALVLLEEEGLRYHPDVVVLGFYANDFEDNFKAGLFELRDGELVVAKHEHIPGVRILNVINSVAPLRWLSENSYAYSFLLNQGWQAGKALLAAVAEKKVQTEYAVTTEEVNRQKMELAGALIRRMAQVCRDNGFRFVILDIAHVPKTPGTIQSSLPDEMLPMLREQADALIDSRDLFNEYRQTATLHLPHGHHHISAFSHLMYGTETGRRIVRWFGPDAAPRALPRLDN